MQRRGVLINENQLRFARNKHTPTRQKRVAAKIAARFEPSPRVIALLVANTDMPNKELLVLVNAEIQSVRATADGRGLAAGGRARAGGHPRSDGVPRTGVCRCRGVGYSSPRTS